MSKASELLEKLNINEAYRRTYQISNSVAHSRVDDNIKSHNDRVDHDKSLPPSKYGHSRMDDNDKQVASPHRYAMAHFTDTAKKYGSEVVNRGNHIMVRHLGPEEANKFENDLKGKVKFSSHEGG